MRLRLIIVGLAICFSTFSIAQEVSTYTNPVIHADYSDPDVVRVGNDYYMTASSFNHIPGLPILHSTDLVNWKLIGYALHKLIPADHYSKVQHGGGVWAPSIQYHQSRFYIFYPDPDFGIYQITAKQITGPWSEPILIEKGKGLIDPTVLWDDDGKCFLVHAYAGSRAGLKSILALKELNATATKSIGETKIIYDGHGIDPTIEGPKLYKRNGWYYVFAPAGGVSTGWQTVLKAKNIGGPYERKVVMAQGISKTNGPHQGAWVNTVNGENWFLHFQDKELFGRVVHLQPMRWINDWPVIGVDEDGDGIGTPVTKYRLPIFKKNNHTNYTLASPWQWQANASPLWMYQQGKQWRLYANTIPDNGVNYWHMPSLYMQKFPADSFSATTHFSLSPLKVGERAGMIIFGTDYAGIFLEQTKEGMMLKKMICMDAEKGNADKVTDISKLAKNDIYIKTMVTKQGICNFYYSINGIDFVEIDGAFLAKPGKWVGAKIGLFCSRPSFNNDAGYMDIDYFNFNK